LFGASAIGVSGAVLEPKRLRRRRTGTRSRSSRQIRCSFFVIDDPALGAGVVIGRAEPAPRMAPVDVSGDHICFAPFAPSGLAF
jgi:hypothetical protein